MYLGGRVEWDYGGGGVSITYPTPPSKLLQFAFGNASLRVGDSHFDLSSEEYDWHRVNSILSIVCEFVGVFPLNSLVFSLLTITLLKIQFGVN